MYVECSAHAGHVVEMWSMLTTIDDSLVQSDVYQEYRN